MKKDLHLRFIGGFCAGNGLFTGKVNVCGYERERDARARMETMKSQVIMYSCPMFLYLPK